MSIFEIESNHINLEDQPVNLVDFGSLPGGMRKDLLSAGNENTILFQLKIIIIENQKNFEITENQNLLPFSKSRKTEPNSDYSFTDFQSRTWDFHDYYVHEIKKDF